MWKTLLITRAIARIRHIEALAQSFFKVSFFAGAKLNTAKYPGRKFNCVNIAPVEVSSSDGPDIRQFHKDLNSMPDLK